MLALYDYPLEGVRIATAPAEPRDAARLLVADRTAGAARHHCFRELPELLAPGDLLVVNDTRVLPVRLFATRQSGGEVELLLHPTGLDSGDAVLALLKPSARLKAGEWLAVRGGPRVQLLDPPGSELRRVAIEGGLAAALAVGTLPLPPYLGRPEATASDQADYQTLFASAPGAIAAPTAGLHFTPAVCERLAARGIELARVTLHVGPGTFLPVRAERLRDHAMHEELYEVSEALVAAIAAARARGGRVIAVGTTTTRALESAASSGTLVAGRARTRLMIRPPFAFRVLDGLVTNFHLPKTTLLALVAAFTGRERMLALYREAAAAGYRFYSYGDAMLLLDERHAPSDSPPQAAPDGRR
ncbi:MAG: tRNA preQ1(34) S-adenosylmethionine ribosyltransferase-isomerase QueA [Planctomycetes bacterium]|nr:tRNA preQ1(34) S-adenosylmethionine ribosyltransferase-isomerase QueA [Planctomycetota bacterium]